MNFDVETLSLFVGWLSLGFGAVSLALGFYLAWIHRKVTPTVQQGLGEQAGLTDVITGTAELAKALKDLDKSAQLMTIGVLLIGIASIVAGLESVAKAISSAG